MVLLPELLVMLVYANCIGLNRMRMSQAVSFYPFVERQSANLD